MPSRSGHIVRWALNYQLLLYCIITLYVVMGAPLLALSCTVRWPLGRSLNLSRHPAPHPFTGRRPLSSTHSYRSSSLVNRLTLCGGLHTRLVTAVLPTDRTQCLEKGIRSRQQNGWTTGKLPVWTSAKNAYCVLKNSAVRWKSVLKLHARNILYFSLTSSVLKNLIKWQGPNGHT